MRLTLAYIFEFFIRDEFYQGVGDGPEQAGRTLNAAMYIDTIALYILLPF